MPTTQPPAIQIARTAQVVHGQSRPARHRPGHPVRHRVRPARSQRRRQDDRDQHPHHPAHPRRRHRSRRRLRRRQRSRQGPRLDRRRRTVRRRRWTAHRRGEPSHDGEARPPRHQARHGPHRRTARTVRPHRGSEEADRHLFRRHGPPLGPGHVADAQPSHRLPRRADHRRRPARTSRHVGHRARAGRTGHDDLPQPPVPRRGDQLASRVAVIDGGSIIADGTRPNSNAASAAATSCWDCPPWRGRRRRTRARPQRLSTPMRSACAWREHRRRTPSGTPSSASMTRTYPSQIYRSSLPTSTTPSSPLTGAPVTESHEPRRTTNEHRKPTAVQRHDDDALAQHPAQPARTQRRHHRHRRPADLPAAVRLRLRRDPRRRPQDRRHPRRVPGIHHPRDLVDGRSLGDHR